MVLSRFPLWCAWAQCGEVSRTDTTSGKLQLTQFESAVNMNNPMLIPGMTEEQLMIGKGRWAFEHEEDDDVCSPRIQRL